MLRLRKLLLLFGPSDWFRFGLIVLLMLGGAVLELIGLGAVPAFVAVVGRPDLVDRYPTLEQRLRAFGIDSAADLITWGSALLILLFFLRTFYMVVSYYIQDRVVRNRQVELSHRLFDAYLRAPYTYHLTHNSAYLLRNATGEVERVAAEVLSPLLVVLRQGIVMTAIVALVLWTDPSIGLFTLVFLGLGGLSFLHVVSKRMSDYGTQEHRARGAQYQAVNEALSVLREIRILGREDAFLAVHHGHAEQVARPQQYRDTVRRSTWPVLELIVVAGLLIAAVAMIRTQGDLHALMPTLALFTVALARLKGCATEFVSSLTQVRYGLVSVDAVYDDLMLLERHGRQARETASRSVPARLRFQDAIVLDGVSFRYGDDLPDVVRGVSLRIPRGSSVAFVGPTGSGKSTLADIAAGLLVPRQGRVLVDGQDIARDLRAWQSRIGYIPQAVAILDATLTANVALGIPEDEVDGRALSEALRAAQLEDTVAALPDGLHTHLGERGTRLSGGQRQRVAIARALYHNPDVLIMDEGTSALDTATERAVVDAVERLKGERTLIMIAHRLTTVMRCDCIFLVHHGQVVAQGTYGELLASSPEFAGLAMVDGAGKTEG
ncbi:MAG: ABC transporter ATP-binding protein [Lentisphaeria bacterium]|nr:ABC transporter ATP-binding protein [Lentisphaeria bacterium]